MEYLDLKSNKERIIIDFLGMGFENLVLLGHYSYNEAKETLEMHKHTDMLEICYLETGHQHYQVGDEVFLLKGGDLLITPPNVIHGTSGYPEEKGNLFWMIFKVPTCTFKLLNLSKKESDLVIKKILDLPGLHFKGSRRIKIILREVFSVYNNKKNLFRKIEIKNLILNFLLEVIKCGEKLNSKLMAPDIEFVCNYISKNLFNRISISSLAEAIHLSESRFKHKFKMEVGIPPNEYILKKKIGRAKEEIQNQKIAITDLAYDLGFSSPSYFSTVFKKYEGVSPSEYKDSV